MSAMSYTTVVNIAACGQTLSGHCPIDAVETSELWSICVKERGQELPWLCFLCAEKCPLTHWDERWDNADEEESALERCSSFGKDLSVPDGPSLTCSKLNCNKSKIVNSFEHKPTATKPALE